MTDAQRRSSASTDLSIALGQDGARIAIVEDVSFSIGRGEVLALVGESGSGKSVTALSLMQLLSAGPRRSPSGSIVLRARDGFSADIVDARLERARRSKRSAAARMGMIFQEPMSSFSPIHTIGAQICEVVHVHENVGRARRRATAPPSCSPRSASPIPWARSTAIRRSSPAACASAR